jgi:hypothetical protein
MGKLDKLKHAFAHSWVMTSVSHHEEVMGTKSSVYSLEQYRCKFCLATKEKRVKGHTRVEE